MTLINTEAWKQKYPNRCAIVKLNPDQAGTGYLVEQHPRKGEALFKSHFNLWYGHQEGYAFI